MAKSIRIYSPHFPVPVSEGAFQVVFDQTRTLANLGFDVELVVWHDSEADVIERRRQIGVGSDVIPPNVRVTCLDPTRKPRLVSSGNRESLPQRAQRVVKSLASEIASPEEVYYPSRLSTRWARLRRPVDWAIYHSSFSYVWLRQTPLLSQLGEQLDQLRQGAWLRLASRETGPTGDVQRQGEARRAVVFHNLESDLFAERRERALERRSPSAWIHELNARKLKRHETALGGLAHELWFISPEDQRHYVLRNPEAQNTRLVAPTYSRALRALRVEAFRKASAAAPAKKKVLGFLGGMHFLPNRISAEWIIERLAPRLAERGFDGTLRIAGRGASPDVSEKAARFPFVRLDGFLPDLEEFWSSLSHSLVPHLSGSGVRTKLLEALASGVPTLATPGAVSRIHPALRDHPLLFCSEDPDAWAARLVTCAPFAERIHHLNDPFPETLEGERVYRFLTESD